MHNFVAEEYLAKGTHVYPIRKFLEVTGMYHNLLFFLLLDIKPDTLLGDFAVSRLPEVEDFVARNSDFHIISSVGPGIIVNQAWHNPVSYRIGDGDPNPWIYFLV